ncbi:two-partner secretion domain-containing protein [Enterobacter soli]|uniref:two-partner secretion domain-containing protein n=1 Tax=Enterobacter soli TaxID=885040 RepID=UPI0034CEBC99
MFKFKMSYVALAAALTSTCVIADPTTYTLNSGTKVIDIEAPNAAGVSHNMYREFNVSNKGAVLNNSSTDVSHATLGNIAKNNNLTNGSASVILNEVVSNKASALNGFIEVNGQKADVVIANPNGISCSGCNFINTNKVTLTTGSVKLDESGAISSYSVTGGKISVDAYGMYANEGYANLLADVISLNGIVNAKNATLSAGNFTYDNATGAITSAGKSANLVQTLIPEYSIDVSSLGGVKANSIKMVGNNLGFGVRNKGAIVANSTLAMASNGSLVNEGSITSNGFLAQLVSAGGMKNSGTIETQNIALLTSGGTLNNSGTITNASQMAITAIGDIENSGTIHGTNVLAVGTNGSLKTQYGSLLKSDNQLTLTAMGNITNGGSTHARTLTADFGGDTFNVTGNMSATDITLKSAKNGTLQNGTIVNDGALTGDTIELQTNGALVMGKNSSVKASTALNTKSYSLDNAGNIHSKTAALYFDNYVTTNTGQIIGNNVKFWTYEDMLNEGMIQALHDLEINTQNNGNLINRSAIYAGDVMTLAAKKVINGGYGCGLLKMSTCGVGTLKANSLVLNSSHKYASEVGGTQQFKWTEINTVQ